MEFFGIASQLNNREFLLAGGTPFGPIGFLALDDAIGVFKNFYELLTLERGSQAYLDGIGDLLFIAPAIYRFEMDDLHKIMAQWRDGQMAYKAEIQILPVPHLLVPMKSGFLENHIALDIVQDIEQKVTIDPNGKIELQTFKVHYMKQNSTPPPIEPLTEKDLIDELKKRGFS